LKNNFKYWLLGNIIAVSIGISTLILHMFIINSFLYEIFYYDVRSMTKFIFFISPFLAGLTIKLVKKDIPFYYYCTVGITFLFLFILFICFIESKVHLSDYFFTTLFYIRLKRTLIYSTFGGIIALLLNNFLAHRKKIFKFIQ